MGVKTYYENKLWVALGQGTNRIAYSSDGINWTGLGTSVLSSYGRRVAWNGSMWVAVGQGTNTIAYSSDGIDWTGLGTSIFSIAGLGVAWNGSMWVAVGEGGNSIAYSSDGINWTGLRVSTFSTRGLGVAWNGSMWVAVGRGTNSIAYSSDGINWTGLGTSIISTQGRGVAWNGNMWVALGQGTNRIAYSSDGINWTGLGVSVFSTQGLGVAWNGSMWVAVGQGTNSIAYSSDGINWTGLGRYIFSTQGLGVAWNGSMWVAVGQGTNSIAYSSDGINWTGLGTGIFSTLGYGVASIPAPNLYPPIGSYYILSLPKKFHTFQGTSFNEDGLVLAVNKNSIKGKEVYNLVTNEIIGTNDGVQPSINNDLNFDGIDNKLKIDSILTELSTTTTGTWECVVRFNSVIAAGGSIILSFGDTNGAQVFNFSKTLTGKIQLMVRASGATLDKFTLQTTNVELIDKKYYHITVVQDGVAPKMYINGVFILQQFTIANDTTAWFSDAPLLDSARIGGSNYGSGGERFHLDGSVEYVKIYTKALTEKQIKEKYNKSIANQLTYKETFEDYPIGETRPKGWMTTTGAGVVKQNNGTITSLPNGKKYFECTQDGIIYFGQKQAYGSWYFGGVKNVGTSIIRFMNESISTNLYYLELQNSGSDVLVIFNEGATAKFSSTIISGSGKYYDYLIQRLSSTGKFYLFSSYNEYPKDTFIVFYRESGTNEWNFLTPTSGSNPFIDSTGAVSNYVTLDLDTGTGISEIKTLRGVEQRDVELLFASPMEYFNEIQTWTSGTSVNTYIDGPAHGKGSGVFVGGVLMSNGNVCLVPSNSPNIGIYNPISNTYTDGPLHEKGASAFRGGILMPDGNVCFIPFKSSNVGIYDPTSNTYIDGPAHGQVTNAFHGGVLMSDGNVCLIPNDSPNIGIYNPTSNTYIDGPAHGIVATNIFEGGVLMSDGNVCLVPRNSPNIGIYNPTLNTYTNGPTHGKGTNAFIGGVLMPDGNVCLVPYISPNIGIYNPISNTYTNGPAHGKAAGAFITGVLMPDGNVCLTPYSSPNIGIYNPISNTYTNGPTHGTGSNAFFSCTLMSNGNVCLIPIESPNIGIYDPDDQTKNIYYLLSAVSNKL